MTGACLLRPSLAVRLFAGVALFFAATAGQAQEAVVEVSAGPIRRELPIVRWNPPADFPIHSVEVFDPRAPDQPCDWQRDNDQLVWRARSPLTANETVHFRIRFIDPEEGSARRNPGTLRVTSGLDRLEIATGHRPIVQYNTEAVEPPEGVPSRYRRSGHLHPVWTPSGRIVTDEFPADHRHQHAIFSAWVNTWFQGRATDFWNQGGGTGTVVHSGDPYTEVGAAMSTSVMTLEHQALRDGAEPEPALSEKMTLRVYGSPRPELNVFDVELLQKPAGNWPVHVLKYHYGGFAIRGAAEWYKQDGSGALTSEGKNQKTGNESRPRWAGLSGKVEGADCGLVVIPHPDSFRYPQPVRLHPDKPYFVFSPPILGGFDITADRPYQARYRIVVHDGPVQPRLMDQLAEEYANPLVVSGIAPDKPPKK